MDIFLYLTDILTLEHSSVMHGKRETNILFVFRILEFEVNFGNFIRVACILHVGLVQTLNLQLGY
jgi:hypothetical protein